MTTLTRTRIAVIVFAALPVVMTSAAPAATPSVRFRREFARADSLAFRGRTPYLAYMDSLIAVARRTGNTDLEMAAEIRRAGMRAFFDGSFGESQAESRRWLPRLRASRDTLLWCIALRTIAYSSLSRQQFSEAGSSYVEVLRLARLARLGVMEGYARVGLAFIAMRDGRAREAERGYRIAIERITEPGEAHLARTARAGLANALLQQGRPAAARLEYERVLTESRAAGDLRNAADALNDLGALEFGYGDPSLAIPHYREAAALQRRAGNRANELMSLANVAQCLSSIGHVDEAGALLDTVVTAAGRAGARDVLDKALVSLALLRIEADRLADADSLAGRVVAMRDSVRSSTWADAVVALARARASAGRPKEGIALIEPALAQRGARMETAVRAGLLLALGALRTDAGDPATAIPPLREALATRERFRGTIGASAIMGERELARAFVALGRRDSALAHLRAATSAWERNRILPGESSWREAFGGAAASLFAQYAALLLDPASGGRAPDRTASTFSTLQTFRARTLEDALSGGERTRATPRVTLAVLQRRVLRPGEILLDLYMAPDTSFLFAVTRDSLRAVGLAGGRRLSPGLRRFRDLLAAEDPDEALVETASAALGDQLFGKVADLLRSSRTALLATGRSAQYPIGMLRIPGESDPLSVRRRWAIIASATLLARTRSEAAPRQTKSHALLALSRSTDGQGRQLAGVEREIRWLIRTFPDAESRENDGRRPLDAMLAHLGPREVLHIASHVRGSPEAPWRAGFLLGRGRNEEAYLTAARIAGLGRTARLCVLTGCTSAGGALGSEAMPGLAAAWLASGSSAVIASLWPVGDEATAEMVRDFYAELAQGRTAGDALGDAQRLARSRRHSRLRDWAGFVLIGDPETTVRLIPRGPHRARAKAWSDGGPSR
ncbi:MAG: CHAT domain-containing protein [Candidatus Eisenbacteria bacterium]|nr:CHAT domain-containing protein [Candidatus Eisenbacteria bacterium]